MRPLLLTIISFFLIACGRTHKLSKADLKFNPYKAGDTLIFQSSDSVVDTVFIHEILRQTVPLGYPFDHSKRKSQSLSVLVHHSNPTLDTLLNINKGSILMLDNYGEGTLAEYWFNGKTKPIAISNHFPVEILDTLSTISVSTKAGNFDDVLLLKSDTVYPTSFDRLSKVYWSKKYGYVKIEINGDYKWELIKRLPVSN